MMASNPQPKSEEELVAEAFRRFDVDGDGVLTVDELRQGMISLGEDMTDEEIEDMMRAADVNGDGVIDYNGRRGDRLEDHAYNALQKLRARARMHAHTHTRTHTLTHT